jgi:hypothetical protein
MYESGMDVDNLSSPLPGTTVCHRAVYALTAFVARARANAEPPWFVLRL